MMRLPRFLLSTAVLAPLLAGCGGLNPGVADLNGSRNARDNAPTTGLGSGLSLFSTDRSRSDAPADTAGGSGIGVNAYLWRGALDTLSFMPLASADPFGGVIITDWYSPPSANGERFKATAYILGRQLRADGVRLSVFRQIQQGGQWVDVPVAPSTTGEIENKVLARARELRAQSAAN